MMIKFGTYQGDIEHLVGEAVMIIPHENTDLVNVQFSNMNAENEGVRLGYNWHVFPSSDFVVTSEKDDGRIYG